MPNARAANLKFMNKKQVFAVSGAVAVSLLMAVPAFAETTSTITPATAKHPSHFAVKGGMHKFNGIIGTVSAINNDTITVTSKTGTVYAVDATHATIQKGFGKTATALTVSNIAVNDMVAVQGTVSGDSVTATRILDGIAKRSGTYVANGHQQLANAAFGTISNVNGSTLTLTRKTKSGTDETVTVTTTPSTIYKKNGKADTASDVAVGQRIVAMGTKDSSGNIAAATSVNIMVREPRSATGVPQIVQ